MCELRYVNIEKAPLSTAIYCPLRDGVGIGDIYRQGRLSVFDMGIQIFYNLLK